MTLHESNSKTAEGPRQARTSETIDERNSTSENLSVRVNLKKIVKFGARERKANNREAIVKYLVVSMHITSLDTVKGLPESIRIRYRGRGQS